MHISDELIQKCKDGDTNAQKIIYETFSSLIYAVCRRYVGHKHIAEDLLQETFITVYTKIDSFKGKGSFEGWIRKIAINISLMYLRDKKKEIFNDDYDLIISEKEKDYKDEKNDFNLNDKRSVIEKMNFSQADIFESVEKLPSGFRTVFNLYVIEGFRHKEVSEMLGVSEGTSKSQLLRARKKLMQILYKKAIKRLKEKNS